MSNDIFQTLWVGKPLTNLEHLCLKSFIDNGHIVHLYTYDTIGNVPKGVIIKDGNEILSKDEIYTYKNGSVSAFSNLFRFTMLYKKGGYWIDADILCVKPLKYNKDYVFSSEPSSDYKTSYVTSSLLKMPKKSEVAMQAINMQREHKKLILNGKISWGSGPKTVKYIVENNNLQKYVLPWNNTCTCAWNHSMSLFNPNTRYEKSINTIKEIPEEMTCIHLWNEMSRRNKINKNGTFHKDSIIEYYKKKHKIMDNSLKDDFILMILSCRKYKTERREGQIKQFLQNNDIMKGMRYFHLVGDQRLFKKKDKETKEHKKRGYIIKENENIIYTNTKDDYLSLPHKTIMGFKALFENYSFKYIFKSDDDQRVIVPKIFSILAAALLQKKPDYVGNMYILHKKVEQYQPRVHAKDGFPKGYVVGDGLPFTNGRLYALSRRNIEDLVTNHFHLIKKELSEDWAIAKYMKKEYRLNNFAFKSLKVMVDYDKYDKYLEYMKNKKK